MIMKKIIVDGKEMYIEISKDEAKENLKKGIDLLFTDEDEEDDLKDEIEDEDNEIKEEDNSEKKTYNYKKNKGFDFDSYKIKDEVNNLSKSIQGMFSGIMSNVGKNFAFDDSSDKKSKTSKLLKVLPFMEEEDIHELFEDILNGDEAFKDINICSILPFLSTEDCDALFLKAVNDGNENINLMSVAPFVSEVCLSKIVDLYLDGKYPDLDIDGLYPFLSSKDVKRVFKHIVSNK